jgi:uncharacterized protein (TIGR03382 family)
MSRPRLKSLATGRVGRMALVAGLAGGMFLGAAGVAQAAVGSDPGGVTLSPSSGSTSSTPTWSTNVACPAGYQGSAVFREVHADGTTSSISPVVNGTAAPFSGTLQAPISTIQLLGGIANGGTQELVVECNSAPSIEGNFDPYMDIYINYSADGTTYTTSTSGTTVPVGEIGGPILAALAALGLGFMQLRRRSRRTQQAKQEQPSLLV